MQTAIARKKVPPADSGDIKLDRRAILGLATGAVASAAAPSFVRAAAASRPSNIVMLDAATSPMPFDAGKSLASKS